jgi:guanosine-3',5'-bis(diphosphate) 3'-pyrophosphohydrolase
VTGIDTTRTEWLSPRLERALRWSAVCHAGQNRKGSGTPYFEHAVAVAMILDRAGFDEDVVIAGLLHDVVEDTDATFEDVSARFGSAVCETVCACTEVKHDEQGRKRPWIDRKRDHLAALPGASQAARAVMLADKLHNLTCIELDLAEGRPVWSQFNAERTLVLWYYRATIAACAADDPRLDALAAACLERMARLDPEHARCDGAPAG